MSAKSVASGRFSATVVDAWAAPRVPKAKPPVVYCHGAGPTENGSQMFGANGMRGNHEMVMALVAAGYSFVGMTAPDSWGNALSRTRINDALTWGRAKLGMTNDPAILMGNSMGVCVALRYALTDPANVACVIGAVPALDLDYLRDTNPSGLRAKIDTAWGVVYPAALPVGTNPADELAALSDIPMQLWYSSDDVISTGVATFESDAGAEIHNVGALGHTNTAITAVNKPQMVAFVESIVS